MDFQKIITSNIKKLRLSHGLTQEEFGERVGLSVQAVSNIERNKYMPSAQTINNICKEFDTLPDVLYQSTTINKSKVGVLRLINSILEKLSLVQLKQILEIIKTFDK